MEEQITKESRDESTTPKWLQIPALIVLCAITVYFTYCFHVVFRDGQPTRFTTLGGWSMFTKAQHFHLDMEGQVRVDGKWSVVDLKKLFPSRFDSGYRFSRGPFYNTKSRIRTLARSTCLRADPVPERVRLYRLRWRKYPGVPASAKATKNRKLLMEWNCKRQITLPNGGKL